MGDRSASTVSSAQPVADVQPDFYPLSTSPVSSDQEFLSTSLDDITSSVPPPVHEHIGFLKELGLDYGWGPTAMVEWLLEHVHVYTGTPWWATIGLSLLILRAALLKLYIDAADAAARNQVIKPHVDPLMERYKAAAGTRDVAGMRKITTEIRSLRKSAGIKYWKISMPLIQIPLGYGAFRLMRGMANLPVPGLETGGLLWMQDLTLSDPYFILPLATGALYFFSFKVNREKRSSIKLSNFSRLS